MKRRAVVKRMERDSGQPHAGTPRIGRLWLVGALLVAVAAISAPWGILQADVRDSLPASHAPSAPEAWIDDLSPITAAEWNYDRAAHLLERAGFGGTPEEIEKLAAMTPEHAVASLVNYEAFDTSKMPPFEESGIWSAAMQADIDDHLDFNEGLGRARRRGEVYGVKPNQTGLRRLQPVVDALYYRLYVTDFEWRRGSIWWANRMLTTPRPLEEKMTLFWHGHFATEQKKVADYRLLLDQLAMLRQRATGSFRELLVGIGQDPAMLIYLDNRKNVKGQANENFAREIMELFTLGVGNYSETDIKEAARAFTGWTNVGPKFFDRADLHDDGEKTVLGRTGNFNGVDVVNIILEQPAAADYITRKLYRFFVREDLSPAVQKQLAETLRGEDYHFKPLLTKVFLSKDFYSAASVGTQIKSPTQYVISTYRKLGLKEIPGVPYFPLAMVRLGQKLGDPPNVKGWDGGRAWINPSTLLERGNVMGHMLFPETAGDVYQQHVMPERYRFALAEAEQRDREAALGAAAAKREESTALSAKMINSVQEYDLKLGVYNGYNQTFRTVKLTAPTPAEFSAVAIFESTGGKPEAIVDIAARRLLRVPLAGIDRARLVEFVKQKAGGDTLDLTAPEAERQLRELLHLVINTSEYQLN